MNHCLEITDDPAFWILVMGRIEMTRDDDYLRQLLAEYAAEKHWLHHTTGDLNPTPEDAKRDYHTLLLADAGLMTSYTG